MTIAIAIIIAALILAPASKRSRGGYQPRDSDAGPPPRPPHGGSAIKPPGQNQGVKRDG